ncbi:MAG: orotate phosphoribosyltransferase [Saprospiraceae bacterium]|nr:orotate phosphoribosyltransferase [Saprospiraceae bacterium]
MALENEIARNLLQIKAIKLNPQNPFTWASGMRSPIYCDNRVSLSHPQSRNVIVSGLVSTSSDFDPFDAVCGVATAGIAHGALLADRLNLPFAYVRSSAKSHGRQNQIEGELSAGQKVLVIEDLISTGGSSLEAVSVLRENGIEVAGVLAIFDYGFQKAKDNFQHADCIYKTLSHYDVLLSEALSMQYISEDEKNILATWRKDPEHWYEQLNLQK